MKRFSIFDFAIFAILINANHICTLNANFMDDGDGELNDALEGFVYFGESAIEHICLKYHNCDVNTLNDLAELAEKVLELCVLLVEALSKNRNSEIKRKIKKPRNRKSF